MSSGYNSTSGEVRASDYSPSDLLAVLMGMFHNPFQLK